MSPNDSQLRVPPQNLEAERAVLGAMLLNPEAVSIALEILDTYSFYAPEHQKIFSAIKELFQEDKAIDLITVSGKLKDLGLLEQVGGLDYLTEIANVVPSSSNVKHYA